MRWGDLEYGVKNIDVQNDEVQSERLAHGSNERQVRPWWHSDQRLVRRQAVHGVHHLNKHWMWVSEDLTIDSLEFISTTNAGQMVSELPEGQMRARHT